MNSLVGQSAVLLGFLGAVAGVGTLAAGLVGRRPALVRSGRMHVWVVLGAAVVAALVMERALVTHDFSLKYVAANNSRSTPLLFCITGMWSALEGSILLWSLVLAGYLAAVARRFRDRQSGKISQLHQLRFPSVVLRQRVEPVVDGQ